MQVIINKNEMTFEGVDADSRPYTVVDPENDRYRLNDRGDVAWFDPQCEWLQVETQREAIEGARRAGHEVIGYTVTRGEFGGVVETVETGIEG